MEEGVVMMHLEDLGTFSFHSEDDGTIRVSTCGDWIRA